MAVALFDEGGDVFGVADHDDGQLEIAFGYHEGGVGELVEGDVDIFFGVVEFEEVVGGVFDVLGDEAEVEEWRIGEEDIGKNNGLVGLFPL